MARLEQRVKRLEEEASHGHCGHPLGILIDPTEEKVEKLEKQLTDCPNRHEHGSGPGMFVIRFARYGKVLEEP